MLGGVEAYYADVFEVTPQRLWDHEGAVVHERRGARTGWGDVLAFRRGAAVRILAPTDLVDGLTGAVRDRSPDEVFTSEFLAGVLGARVDRVVGPNWRGYVDQQRLRLRPFDNCTRLGADDRAAAHTLRAAVGESDWAEGGFSEDGLTEVSFGAWLGRDLVAAANLTPWRTGADDVGVVTAPQHRGKGYGTVVVSAAVAWALEHVPVVQYRARSSNRPSLALAARLGFDHYVDNIAIRLIQD